MRLRGLGYIAVAGVIVASASVPLTVTAARAESCTPLPGTSPGATIDAGVQQIRVPSISNIAVCTEPAGLPGIPWVSTANCGSPCASVVVTSGSSSGGYVVLKYTSDGYPQEVRAPIPSLGGGGGEVCYAGVGAPARSDCGIKISLDNLPTVPPVPTASVPPVPTASVPPVPTASVPPVPTVPPVATVEPLPTVEPSDPICVSRPTKICVSPNEPIVLDELLYRICALVPEYLLYCQF